VPETTHPSLLARVRDPEDAEAWREFETRYRDLIRRYCRKRGLQDADAEDVSQIVLLALSRALQRFAFDPARGRFRDYLGRVVHNAVLRHATRPKRNADLLDTSVLEVLLAPTAAPPDEPWEREWMLHHYRLAMHAVRAEHAPASLAIFDRLLAGEAVADVAAACGTTPEAVYKVRHRIRERLRERIEQQVRDEDLPRPPKDRPEDCPEG
jgi:RNA polymerase sigma-70 factor (ECF subfamily)